MKNDHIYPVVVERGEDGGYGLYFPDFPGTAVLEDDLSKAIAASKGLLVARLLELEEQGVPFPRPSSPENIELENPGDRIVVIDVFLPPYRDEAAN